MPAVLVAGPTVTHNSLHPLSTSSTTARHVLDFMVQGKIADTDAPTVRLDATPSGLSGALTSIIPHFYAEYPFCRNPPNLSWFGTGNRHWIILAWHTQSVYHFHIYQLCIQHAQIITCITCLLCEFRMTAACHRSSWLYQPTICCHYKWTLACLCRHRHLAVQTRYLPISHHQLLLLLSVNCAVLKLAVAGQWEDEDVLMCAQSVVNSLLHN